MQLHCRLCVPAVRQETMKLQLKFSLPSLYVSTLILLYQKLHAKLKKIVTYLKSF